MKFLSFELPSHAACKALHLFADIYTTIVALAEKIAQDTIRTRNWL